MSAGCLSTSSYWAVGQCCWWKLCWPVPSLFAHCFCSSLWSTATKWYSAPWDKPSTVCLVQIVPGFVINQKPDAVSVLLSDQRLLWNAKLRLSSWTGLLHMLVLFTSYRLVFLLVLLVCPVKHFWNQDEALFVLSAPVNTAGWLVTSGGFCIWSAYSSCDGFF